VKSTSAVCGRSRRPFGWGQHDTVEQPHELGCATWKLKCASRLCRSMDVLPIGSRLRERGGKSSPRGVNRWTRPEVPRCCLRGGSTWYVCSCPHHGGQPLEGWPRRCDAMAGLRGAGRSKKPNESPATSRARHREWLAPSLPWLEGALPSPRRFQPGRSEGPDVFLESTRLPCATFHQPVIICVRQWLGPC